MKQTLAHGCEMASAGKTLIFVLPVATCPAESVTLTSKLKLPAAVSLPVSVPPPESARPGGSVPLATTHV